MALDPSQFEVIGNAQANPDQFEPIGDAKPALDLSKLGTDPYEKYRLALAHGATPENYSEIYGFNPSPLNPDWDAVKAGGLAGPALTVAGQLVDAAGHGIVKLADIPTKIRNKAVGAEDFNNPFHKETLEEREDTEGSLFKLPRVDTSDLKGAPAVIGGVENRLASTVEDMLGRPSSAFTLPLLAGEGALAKTVAGVYGLNAAAQVPEEIKHAVDVYNDPDSTTADKADAIANPVVHGALSYMMLKHAGGKAPAPEVQGPYALGSVMQTPRGAVPDLKVEDFEPLDAQSGSPISPQESAARQARAPVLPETPERPVKTFNLDEGEPNAGEIPSTESVPKSEVRPPVGERAPLRQQGKTPEAPAQANEPVPQAGDARGTPDKAPELKDDLDKVSSMSDKEFSDWSNENRLRGGMTGVAHEIGQGVQSLEEVNDLKARQDAEAEKFQEAKKKKDFPAMSAAANKGQFFREAYEAATGTGSAGKSLRESNPNYTAPFPEGKSPEMVGMGGAVPSEFESGAGEGRDVYGISHEVREARAKAGVVEPVERGKGISAEDSVERGQALLNGGVDPEAALNNFESTGRLKADDIAVTRARGEELARDARAAERKFGTESPEYKAAYDKLSDWDRRTKKMQTEWHRQGMAQQGATDIDTGSFTGIQREFEDQTGKKFTPKQEKEAKDISGKVNEAADQTEIARTELFSELDKDLSGMSDAEKRAIDAANKTVREAAVRRAEAESKQRMVEAQAKNDIAKVQREAARKAKSAADKTVRDDAVRKAKEESQQRIDDANKQRKLAEVELARAKRAQDAVNKRARDAAAKRAQAERKELGKSLSERAWDKAREYIESGVTDFDDIRNKLATDLGLPVEKVTAELARTKRAKYLTDELWKKQQDYRRLDQQAKRWLAQQQMPWITKQLQKIPDAMFGAKVFGHGTVALGTHAPMVAFQPKFWGDYIRNFADMYRMSMSNSLKPGEFQKSAAAFYEKKMQDLVRRPNYVTARRAGLVNDPFEFEDYNAPNVTRFLGPFGKMGDRGYAVLKLLRQDMFDQYWNNLPKTQQIPEVAKAIADGVNHATGVIRSSPPKYSNIALFAPRLALSRGAWLVGDPLRAIKTGLDWKNADLGDKVFTMNQIKEKAWVVGTMLSLLALNEGFLEATGSKQRVNVTDPMKRDWMKFKVGGLNVGYGNAMLAMARLPARLYRIRESDGGKMKNLVYPDEDTYSVLGEYGRSQLSPFASLASTLWFKSDWQNRPLPNSNRPVPKRLAQRGVKPYTWPEFWTEQVLPIPLEEGAREVWKSGLGMTDEQQRQARKALATISVMMATGARVEDDTDVASPENH